MAYELHCSDVEGEKNLDPVSFNQQFIICLDRFPVLQN